ncbi:hypothetical protein DRH29_01875 [candidate division Kazan bacterium]|uniref:Helix-hairpin-helix DNA-binding motif class 1 domain-containing protein n=1 Tax=candidate division Kazan bacterium TaxID=2202143 RepID=A0A420ZD13_UNCK3|nr:MAG: hypothetical protein DRH29_01875 [candidate division Kazan bacterium]
METLLSPFTPEPELERNKLEFFEQYKYWILGILLIISAIGIYLILTPPVSTLAEDDDIFVTDQENIVGHSLKLVVDVSGGVNHPGVYELDAESIIEDAIAAAGGFSPEADIDEIARNINRAALVDNHSKIYLPKIGDNQIVYISPPSYSSSNSATDTSNNQITDLININTATNSELDSLPGIGPITAQRIIDYRLQNGGFSDIDEIKKVYGISDSKFNNLKDRITV